MRYYLLFMVTFLVACGGSDFLPEADILVPDVIGSDQSDSDTALRRDTPAEDRGQPDEGGDEGADLVPDEGQAVVDVQEEDVGRDVPAVDTGIEDLGVDEGEDAQEDAPEDAGGDGPGAEEDIPASVDPGAPVDPGQDVPADPGFDPGSDLGTDPGYDPGVQDFGADVELPLTGCATLYYCIVGRGGTDRGCSRDPVCIEECRSQARPSALQTYDYMLFCWDNPVWGCYAGYLQACLADVD